MVIDPVGTCAHSRFAQVSTHSEDVMDSFHTIRGTFVIHGYAPDGDSIRFLPDAPSAFDRFPRTAQLRVAHDGSVQLRLAAIDAPELHYDMIEQPLGRRARDFLLASLGFEDVLYQDVFVTSARPTNARGAILSREIDMCGRPIAYVLRDGHVSERTHSSTLRRSVLARTVNAALVREGLAYALSYDVDPALHRAYFRKLAHDARRARLGIWATDATVAGLDLRGHGSIGLHGDLVFPKLFRRCVHYLDDRATGYRSSLRAWLAGHRREDDVVILPSHRLARLSDLLRERGPRIAMRIDPTDVTFVAR